MPGYESTLRAYNERGGKGFTKVSWVGMSEQSVTEGLRGSV